MAFDIVFMIIFCWAIYKGYTKGFLFQAASLAALIIGIWGAIQFSDFTSSFIIEKFGTNGQYLPLISFAITFVAIVIGIHFLAKISEKLLEMISLNFINRLLGVVFNVAKYAFIISAVLVVINSVNRNTHFMPAEKIHESKLYKPLSGLAPMLFPYLHFDFTHPFDVPEAPEDVIGDDEVLV